MNDIETLIVAECNDLADMLIAKNRKYGNSALKPKRIFSKADPLEQLNIRIDDKLSRIASAQADEDEDPEMDLIGYLILKRVAKRLLPKPVQQVPNLHRLENMSGMDLYPNLQANLDKEGDKK